MEADARSDGLQVKSDVLEGQVADLQDRLAQQSHADDHIMALVSSKAQEWEVGTPCTWCVCVCVCVCVFVCVCVWINPATRTAQDKSCFLINACHAPLPTALHTSPWSHPLQSVLAGKQTELDKVTAEVGRLQGQLRATQRGSQRAAVIRIKKVSVRPTTAMDYTTSVCDDLYLACTFAWDKLCTLFTPH